MWHFGSILRALFHFWEEKCPAQFQEVEKVFLFVFSFFLLSFQQAHTATKATPAIQKGPYFGLFPSLSFFHKTFAKGQNATTTTTGGL